MAHDYSYRNKRDDWNKRPNKFLPGRTEKVQYPKGLSSDKNMEAFARAVYEYPGETRWFYVDHMPVSYVNKRLFYGNCDVAIRFGLVFMVNWKCYPSPLWDFEEWKLVQ